MPISSFPFESYTIVDDENDQKKPHYYFICEKSEQWIIVP